MKKFRGSITATKLSDLAEDDVQFGFITIKSDTDEKALEVKVDNYTEYDSLEPGEYVEVEYETLGNTDVIVARKITHLSKE
ncbi:MAG: hypothetical protein BAJATHORv1_20386 [Candidatus Thorarchaeota archaeon]|nr:MAG: hypothetical protein BAJATHORv1_20386 [Candidatus Thorarchaeota archaeon]